MIRLFLITRLICASPLLAAGSRREPPRQARMEIPSSLADQPLWSDEDIERFSPAANKAFFRMMEHWKVEDDDARALLNVSPERFAQLRENHQTTLEPETLTRVRHLVGIYESINTLYSAPHADRWIQNPNTGPIMRGKTPLKHMVEGGLAAIEELRRYVDAVRWGN